MNLEFKYSTNIDQYEQKQTQVFSSQNILQNNHNEISKYLIQNDPFSQQKLSNKHRNLKFNVDTQPFVNIQESLLIQNREIEKYKTNYQICGSDQIRYTQENNIFKKLNEFVQDQVYDKCKTEENIDEIKEKVEIMVDGSQEEVEEIVEEVQQQGEMRYFLENSQKSCYRCKKSGHLARTCPEEGQQEICFFCLQEGHKSSRCTQIICFKCNKMGHMGKDCKEINSKPCHICYRKGHLQRDCNILILDPKNGIKEISMLNIQIGVKCQKKGHIQCNIIKNKIYDEIFKNNWWLQIDLQQEQSYLQSTSQRDRVSDYKKEKYQRQNVQCLFQEYINYDNKNRSYDRQIHSNAERQRHNIQQQNASNYQNYLERQVQTKRIDYHNQNQSYYYDRNQIQNRDNHNQYQNYNFNDSQRINNRNQDKYYSKQNNNRHYYNDYENYPHKQPKFY